MYSYRIIVCQIYIYISIYIGKYIFTEKSCINDNPLYRDIPYVYMYVYIYIHIYLFIYRESYTEKSLLKGNPVYRDIPKRRSLVKGSLVKGPLIHENPLIQEIHYNGQAITYKRNHLYMEIPYKGQSLKRGIP